VADNNQHERILSVLLHLSDRWSKTGRILPARMFCTATKKCEKRQFCPHRYNYNLILFVDEYPAAIQLPLLLILEHRDFQEDVEGQNHPSPEAFLLFSVRDLVESS